MDVLEKKFQPTREIDALNPDLEQSSAVSRGQRDVCSTRPLFLESALPPRGRISPSSEERSN